MPIMRITRDAEGRSTVKQVDTHERRLTRSERARVIRAAQDAARRSVRAGTRGLPDPEPERPPRGPGGDAPEAGVIRPPPGLSERFHSPFSDFTAATYSGLAAHIRARHPEQYEAWKAAEDERRAER